MPREILDPLDVRITCIELGIKMPTGVVYIQDFPEGASGPKEAKKLFLGPEIKAKVPFWEILDVEPKL